MDLTNTRTSLVQAARQALESYPIASDAQLEFVSHRENCVFRVTDAMGAYALRLHRPGYRNHRELQSEAAFTTSLADRGMPVARFVATRAGGHLVVATSSTGEQFTVDVQVWIENVGPLGDIETGFDGTSPLTPSDFRSIGALTAGLHNAGAEFDRPHDYQRSAWDLEGIFGRAAILGDPFTSNLVSDDQYRVLRAASERASEILTSIGKHPSVYGIVHGDITPENLLVTADGLILVDFDDFGDGWYLFDVATTLLFFHPHPRYDAFRAALIAGYTAVRVVDPAVWAQLDVFLFARALTYVGWASSRPEAQLAEFIQQALLPLLLELARPLARG